MRIFCIGRVMVGAVLLFLGVITPSQTAPWKQYSYSDDGFQASYPSTPDLQKKTAQTSAGEFEMRTYAAQVGDTALIVAVSDFGRSVTDRSPDQMLLGAKNSTLLNSASHLVNEKKITLGTNPGTQFEAENSATHFTVRMFLVGTTLYQILIVSPINKPFDQASRFLDSFQLVSRTKGEPKK